MRPYKRGDLMRFCRDWFYARPYQGSSVCCVKIEADSNFEGKQIAWGWLLENSHKKSLPVLDGKAFGLRVVKFFGLLGERAGAG